jgi:hypothetical protein
MAEGTGPASHPSEGERLGNAKISEDLLGNGGLSGAFFWLRRNDKKTDKYQMSKVWCTLYD